MEKVVLPLWKHQEEIIARAVKHNDFALFLDLGTGKTRTSIEIWRKRCNENRRLLRTLVIVPSAVVLNWQNEFLKFTKIEKKNLHPLTGSLAERRSVYERTPQGSVYMVNYEAFAYPKFVEAVLNSPPEFLILDESHKVKDSTAKRTKNLIKLSHLMEKLPVKHRLILTGSPVLNSPMDLFSQFLILDGGKTLGTNFFQFRAMYFQDKNAYLPKSKHFPNWQPKSGSVEGLKAKIAPISAEVKKSECMDLPPFVRTEYEVGLSEEQKQAYEMMKKDFIAFTKSGIATAQLAITKALRLQQVLSGHITLEDGTVHVFKENPRIDTLSDVIDSVGSQKFIVWGVFRPDHTAIKELLHKKGIKFSELTGDIKDKQKEIDLFQNDPSVQAIVASQQAGGTGVNLTAASVAIYYSKSYSLEHDLQSEARCYRGGSEIHNKITRIDLFAKGTVDELVLKALREKKNLADNILDLAEYI